MANYRWLNRSPGGATIFDIRAGDNKANEWQHYAGTFSRADGKAILYINGRNVGEEKARVWHAYRRRLGQRAHASVITLTTTVPSPD